MSRLRQSIIGILAGVGLAVVAVSVLIATGVGPGEPLPNGSPPGEPIPEPAPTTLPEPAPTALPDPDGPGPLTPTAWPTPPIIPEGPPFVGYVMAGDGRAYVYVAPYTASPVIAMLLNGEPVYITCTTRGEAVSSAVTGAVSDLWDYTTLGGYIPDVVVGTGTTEPVKPACLP